MSSWESFATDEPSDPRVDRSLSVDTLRQIDLLCERFERSLQTESPPAIEDWLSRLPDSGRQQAALLRELLALELEYRLRRGEQQPAIKAYLQRFPAHAPVVKLVFQESQADLLPEVPGILAGHSRYRLIRRIGAGGMGIVYLAEHRILKRTVALKVIHPELLAGVEAADRFVREARAAASLNHPNVVAVYDAETSSNGHFLVMEYVVGTDLAQVVRRNGPLSIPQAADYVRQAALGLQHAHEHGMVHRDVTPRNLMLTVDEQVKVLDFGLAYFVGQTRTSESHAGRGTLVGSVDFMAPEQAANPEAADIRADVYGLGCTLYFLLTGKPPFPEPTLEGKLQAHARRPPPSIGDLRDDVPPGLSTVVGRMLEKSPAQRYQTPGEVAIALARFTGGSGPPQELVSTTQPRLARRVTATITVAVVLIGLTLAVQNTEWWRGERPSGDVVGRPTEAQRLYREGLLLLSQRQEPQMRQAIRRLQDAVRADDQLVLGYTALADAYNLCGDYGWEMADAVFPQAKEAARRALALEPDLAEAHLALALALEAHDADWEQAQIEYGHALRLKPQLPAAHHWYAWFLAQQGRFGEAAAHMEEARQLAPDEVIIANNVGKIHYLSRRFSLAVEEHKYALELNPDFRKAHRDLGLAYAEMGRLSDALHEFDQAKGLTEDGRDVLGARAYTLARNGRASEARTLLAKLEPLAQTKPLSYEIATIYAAQGEPDLALNWLRRACEEHAAARGCMAIDPRLDRLRPDPRFDSLRELLRLPLVAVRENTGASRP